MAEYRAMFKCRLCGERYWNGTATGSKDIVLKETTVLLIGAKPSTPMMPSMTEPHVCKGHTFKGCLGVADFIGWESVKEVKA